MVDEHCKATLAEDNAILFEFCRRASERLCQNSSQSGALATRITNNKEAIVYFLNDAEQKDAPNSKIFLLFVHFINSIDGDDLCDKHRPLRVAMFSQPGDPHVKAILATQFLLTVYGSTAQAFNVMRSMLAATDIHELGKSYWPFLAGGELARELGELDMVHTYAVLAKSIHSTCPYIAELAIAGLRTTEEVEHGALSLKDRFCNLPFTNITTSSYTDASGVHYSMSLCTCPGQLRFALDENNPWNGRAAQEIRRSILDGDYSYCDKDNCYAIRMGTLPLKSSITNPTLRNVIDNNLLSLPYSPLHLTLAHDYTCNLACPSCRKSVYSSTKKLQDSHNTFFQNTIEPMLNSELVSIRIGNVGEALASPHILGILRCLDLQQYPSLIIRLMTNGTLANAATMEKMGPIAQRIRHVSVSIDGCSPEVFESLRYPGKWDKLCANMEYLGALRQSGQLYSLRVQCIVQKANVDDLAGLYALCKNWNVDYLVFAQLRNWGTMTPEVFAELDVANLAHPLHEKTRDVLNKIMDEAKDEAISVYIGF